MQPQFPHFISLTWGQTFVPLGIERGTTHRLPAPSEERFGVVGVCPQLLQTVTIVYVFLLDILGSFQKGFGFYDCIIANRDVGVKGKLCRYSKNFGIYYYIFGHTLLDVGIFVGFCQGDCVNLDSEFFLRLNGRFLSP